MNPPWLNKVEVTLGEAVDHGRFPHALLMHGAYGSGRRWLLHNLAARLLQVTTAGLGTMDPVADRERKAIWHPDFLSVQPAQDKDSIGVEQIREMIDFIQLTSHQGGAKVVSLYPADAMTVNAANSLLKTLEEPPAGSVICLVTEALSRLPATIISRCQRVRVPVGPSEIGLSWLQQMDAGPDWAPILEAAGGAPFLALEMHHSGLMDRAVEFDRDLEGLISKRENVIVIARRWMDSGDGFALRWLYQKVAGIIRQRLVGPQGINAPPESGNISLKAGGDGADSEPYFGYLQAVGDLRRLQATGINVEMNLVRLLIEWYGGFRGLRDG